MQSAARSWGVASLALGFGVERVVHPVGQPGVVEQLGWRLAGHRVGEGVLQAVPTR
jgi:hypothetical protein